MAENLTKAPPKGILKNSTSFEGSSASKCASNRGTKWDEMNILATHHPPDKDYGHMKIEEPKTPYSYQGEGSGDEEESHDLDSQLLAERLMADAEKLTFIQPENDGIASDDEEEEEGTPESMEKRKSFEHKRKAHYNEFMAVKLARQLMSKDEDVDSEVGEDQIKTESEEVGIEAIPIEEDSIEAMDTKDSPIERSLEPLDSSVLNTLQS